VPEIFSLSSARESAIPSQVFLLKLSFITRDRAEARSINNDIFRERNALYVIPLLSRCSSAPQSIRSRPRLIFRLIRRHVRLSTSISEEYGKRARPDHRQLRCIEYPGILNFYRSLPPCCSRRIKTRRFRNHTRTSQLRSSVSHVSRINTRTLLRVTSKLSSQARAFFTGRVHDINAVFAREGWRLLRTI